MIGVGVTLGDRIGEVDRAQTDRRMYTVPVFSVRSEEVIVGISPGASREHGDAKSHQSETDRLTNERVM